MVVGRFRVTSWGDGGVILVKIHALFFGDFLFLMTGWLLCIIDPVIVMELVIFWGISVLIFEYHDFVGGSQKYVDQLQLHNSSYMVNDIW